MSVSSSHSFASLCGCSNSTSRRKSLNPPVSLCHTRTCLFSKKFVPLDHLLFNRQYSRKRLWTKLSFLEDENFNSIRRSVYSHCRDSQLCYLLPFLTFHKTRNNGQFLTFSSAEDGVSVNGSPQASTSNDVEGLRVKLDKALQDEDSSSALVQSMHDAARVFELAIKDQSSLSKVGWFSTAWLGVDQNAWVKALSYQAAVYSLLQAASEISSRGDGRDRDINVFVQRSLLRQSALLETTIKDALSAKLPEAYEWFWADPVPAVVTTFVNYFEKDSRFAPATSLYRKEISSSTIDASDKSLLMLALSCLAAITKLGPTKVSCSPFLSMIPETTGRLMDMLVEFVPIRQAYHSVKEIGLRREFLVHFGLRAAQRRVKGDGSSEEVLFWISLVQKQLQRAIDRERIWSKLTTSESIEVLEKDLAIFGFFIALGRRTQSFLSANGFEAVHEPIEGLIRYLIGGSVLYYPQLSSISSYQLYVEVVCEELDWLPFYPGDIDTSKHSPGHKAKQEGPPNYEALPVLLDVCSHWVQSFIKYSKWLDNPSNVKAARFLSRGHKKLQESMRELGLQQNSMIKSPVTEREKLTPRSYALSQKEPDSFDQALESVEEALMRLEELLQKLHVSRSSSGKEQLKAACSDLERIRKLKKEAEFLEASFRAKAASLEQGDQYPRGKDTKSSDVNMDNSSSKPRGLWSFLMRSRSLDSDPARSIAYRNDDELIELAASNTGVPAPESDEIQRFELLRNELIELENRVQRSANRSDNEEEEIMRTEDTSRYCNEREDAGLIEVRKKENIIERSIDKFKETSTDVLQGTQLLAIDVAAALGLLRRVLIGDELTDKEKQALKRTLTDLASVVPIGILMLLPVTAVGHAAMLAAIQRYVPSLIPSTYGSERLDLLRQLEKVKQLEATEVNPSESAEK